MNDHIVGIVDTRARYRGCLLGGAVGDALGAPVEFMSADEIRARFGVGGIRDYVPAFGKLGAITDDTQMTLFTADGLLRAYVRGATRGIVSIEGMVANSYVRWLETQGMPYASGSSSDESRGWLMEQRELFARRAPGRTCLSALMDLQKRGERVNNQSKGCGGVMRVAPVGMAFAHGDDLRVDRIFSIACDIAAITHGHPTGYLSAGAFAVIVALVLRGRRLVDSIVEAKRELCGKAHHEETLHAIEQAEALAVAHPAQIDVRKLGEGWVAEEALAIALCCALVASDFESGVVMAVNHGGDSDSTGSIAGNILGAMHGVHVIPEGWLEPLELRGVIETIADDLAGFRGWNINEYSDSDESRFHWQRYPPV